MDAVERNIKIFEANGYKPTASENPDYKCRCGSNQVYYAELDNDYGDIEYLCAACGREWYYEGSDY